MPRPLKPRTCELNPQIRSHQLTLHLGGEEEQTSSSFPTFTFYGVPVEGRIVLFLSNFPWNPLINPLQISLVQLSLFSLVPTQRKQKCHLRKLLKRRRSFLGGQGTTWRVELYPLYSFPSIFHKLTNISFNRLVLRMLANQHFSRLLPSPPWETPRISLTPLLTLRKHVWLFLTLDMIGYANTTR